MSAAPFATERELDPGPFRAWCEKRLLPKAKDWKHEVGELAGRVTTADLAAELGIDERRLSAWRRENRTLDRDYLEDALHHAGVSITDLYPDLEDAAEAGPKPGPPFGFGSKLTDEQVVVLHRLHVERGLSIRELGRRSYRALGYRSWQAAEYGIRRGFIRLGLESVRRHAFARNSDRRCARVKANGEPCGSFAMHGEDYCWPHHPKNQEEARRRADVIRDLRYAA